MSDNGSGSASAASSAAGSQDSTHGNNGKPAQGQQQPLTFWNKPWHLTGGVPRQTPPPPSWKLSSTVCHIRIHILNTYNIIYAIQNMRCFRWCVLFTFFFFVFFLLQPRVVNGVLLMCLNIGVTPPDVSKPKKCAVMEAWTDPFAQSAKKSLDLIGLLFF